MTKNIFRYSLLLAIFVSFFTYFFDLSNLNGLRQGTEGFYLQISKEMFNLGSFFTPYYRDNLHWSKPFLHFVLPFPFYFTDLFTSVHAARISIALLTLFLSYLASRIISRQTSTSQVSIWVFLLCTLGFIKYGRTFMMEIPLTLFCFVGSLYLYEYLNDKKKFSLTMSVVLLSAAVLIKGPVSLVLSFSSILAYFVISTILYKHTILKRRIILTFFLTTFLSSLWFIGTYMQYGMEFFNYFFLRENVGKFNTISYPMSHVFQGLFLFSLPWSLLIPRLIFESFRKKDFFKNLLTNDFFVFSFTHAIIFFVVWLIPTQRSHHYAMPSVPFFLTSILIATRICDIKDFKILRFSLVGLCLLILSLTLFSITNSKALEVNMVNTYYLYLSLALFILISIFAIRSNSLYSLSISFMAFFGWIWVFFAPIFIPDQFPQQAIDLADKKEVIGYVNKPFFIEEALNRKMTILAPRAIFQNINPHAIYLLTKEDYEFNKSEANCQILFDWKIWKKRTKFDKIIKALSTGNYESIRTQYVLFTCIQSP